MIASFDIGDKNFAYCIANKDQIAVIKHVNIWIIKKQTVLDSCNLVFISNTICKVFLSNIKTGYHFIINKQTNFLERTAA